MNNIWQIWHSINVRPPASQPGGASRVGVGGADLHHRTESGVWWTGGNMGENPSHRSDSVTLSTLSCLYHQLRIPKTQISAGKLPQFMRDLDGLITGTNLVQNLPAELFMWRDISVLYEPFILVIIQQSHTNKILFYIWNCSPGARHDGEPADGGGPQEDGGEQAADGGGPLSHLRLLLRLPRLPPPLCPPPGGGGGGRGGRGGGEALSRQECQEWIQEIFSSPGANTRGE